MKEELDLIETIEFFAEKNVDALLERLECIEADYGADKIDEFQRETRENTIMIALGVNELVRLKALEVRELYINGYSRG